LLVSGERRTLLNDVIKDTATNMAIKKSQLYSSLWQSCDELRGGMDASQYKDYVLTLLFVKYVSDKYAGQKDALLTVPKGGSFADMVAAKNDKEIGDKLNKIIGRLAGANESLKGAINIVDFNDEDKLGKAQANGGPAHQAGGHLRGAAIRQEPRRRRRPAG
jgi:type I restriction-modification system DNA methylase subunit